METDKTYAYIIISPNPSEGQAYRSGDGTLFHYVKIGHTRNEIQGKERVKAYRTHNPNLYWQLLSFAWPLKQDDRKRIWNAVINNGASASLETSLKGSSALFAQRILFEADGEEASDGSFEWYRVSGKTNELQKLARHIEAEGNDEGVVEFKDEEEFLNDYTELIWVV